jgi:hypothetical protein
MSNANIKTRIARFTRMKASGEFHGKLDDTCSSLAQWSGACSDRAAVVLFSYSFSFRMALRKEAKKPAHSAESTSAEQRNKIKQ